MKKLNDGNKNFMETMNALKGIPQKTSGIDAVEFPTNHPLLTDANGKLGGNIAEFYYENEEDKQNAYRFAEICMEATHNTNDCLLRMIQCYPFIRGGIYPTEEIKINGHTYYVDHDKGVLCDEYAHILSELTENEKTRFSKVKNDAYLDATITAILKKRAGLR